MKKHLFSLCIIVFTFCLVGCDNKVQTLNEESVTTASTSTTTSTTISTTTTKENISTTTTNKTTNTTKKSTTTTKAPLIIPTTKRYKINSDEKHNYDYYKYCDENNNCKCTKTDGTPIDC